MTSEGAVLTPRTIAGVVMFGLAVNGIFNLAFDASWPVEIGASTVALYVILSLFLHPRYSLRRDPFAIHNLSRLNVLIGCVFSSVYVAAGQGRLNEWAILVVLSVALVTLILADLGLLFLKTSPGIKLIDRDPHESFAAQFFLFLFVGGWLWRIYAFSHGFLQGTLIGAKLDLTGFSNTYGTLNGIATTAMWGCAVFFRHPRRALPLVGMEIFWLFGTGSKAATLYILIPYLLVLYRRRIVRIDGRFVAGVFLLLGVFVSSFVLVHGYRVAVAKQIYQVGYAELNPIQAVGEIEVGPEDFQLVGKALTERLNFGERFLIILDADTRVPRQPWLGQSYLMALMWAVPRAVWPDKPSMSLGRFFATEYLGWGQESRSEAGVTVWGEGFLNFGIVGALLIPGIWMILLQAVYTLAIGFGRWGLYYVATSYMLLANSLAVNVALSVAGLSQFVVLLIVFRLVVVVGTTITGKLTARVDV